MVRIVFIVALFFLTLVHAEERYLYVQYNAKPDRVIKGEVFPVTIRVFNVLKNKAKVYYSFKNTYGFKILNYYPIRTKKQRYYYDTFYFQAVKKTSKLPDIIVSLKNGSHLYQKRYLYGPAIEVIKLHPRKDFCNIVAKDFAIKKYKTTIYDQKSNIVVFTAEAKRTRLADFHLQNVIKQGFESKKDKISFSKMIYYAVIDKKLQSLDFSYFNVDKNKYIKLSIPIIVDDDRVTTQSDLKPKDQSKQHIKIYIALGVILIGIILLVWKRHYGYIALIIIPALYIGYVLNQVEQVCIKKGAKVTILPLANSTIFELLPQDSYVDKLGKTKGYLKIELKNKKIGWVSEEDVCSY